MSKCKYINRGEYMKLYEDTMIPLGSIVELKSKDKAMIMGYGLEDKKNNQKYDYIGCDYLYGFGKGVTLFSEEDIVKVVFEGYSNEPLIDIYNKKVKEELKNE